MQCNKCRKEAVVYQEYSGQHLCSQHFEADLERKAKHEIRRHRWLEPGDHIAIVLSGDPHSSALLYFLKKLTASRHDIRISAIVIDEGVSGCRNPSYADEIAGASGTDCIRVSCTESYGIDVDEIARKEGIAHSCTHTHCHRIRNFLLERTAIEQGVTKLAVGDDLDDVAASVMENILRGKADMIARSEQGGRRKIPRIHPFIAIPKEEVARYAALHARGDNQSRCPHPGDPFGDDVKEMLEDFTSRHPATKYALLSLKKGLTGGFCTDSGKVPSGEHYGEASEGICVNCWITDEVNTHGA